MTALRNQRRLVRARHRFGCCPKRADQPLAFDRYRNRVQTAGSGLMLYRLDMSMSPDDWMVIQNADLVWHAIETIKESIVDYPAASEDELLRPLEDYGYTVAEAVARWFGWYDEWFSETNFDDTGVSYEDSIRWMKDRLDLTD